MFVYLYKRQFSTLLKSNNNNATFNVFHIKSIIFLYRIDNVHDCLHTKHTDHENNSNEICQLFKLTRMNIKNPMFVIEYEYILHESTKVIIFIILI